LDLRLVELKRLAHFSDLLRSATQIEEKVALVTQDVEVSFFFAIHADLVCNLCITQEYLLKALILIGQTHLLRGFPEALPTTRALFFDQLLQVETFYADLGGIVGYHVMILKALTASLLSHQVQHVGYYPFQGINIEQETTFVRHAEIEGILRMDEMCEIYPLGGAADRLKLFCDKQEVPLPAARLLFCGKTLLEGMIADLQAREYLHYKLFGRQIRTPVAMMTSQEKENHGHILSILEENGWFGRDPLSFRLFAQPLVPTMNTEGRWALRGTMQLLLKPGGHGVIWKLAEREGIFDWLLSLGKKKALVRQVNNPIAGVDYGLAVFVGLGMIHDKHFGFASCPREPQSAEGMNVLIETKQESHYEYALTNLEYCHFDRFEIKENHDYSSNTNILFVDLKAVQEAVLISPNPGMLVNQKRLACCNERGESIEEDLVRLESTMQNIADVFKVSSSVPLMDLEGRLETFLTFNQRKKTISTAKRAFIEGESLLETPEGCFLDLMHNARDLLMRCNVLTEELPQGEVYVQRGLSFLFLYHPALGPFYSMIAQKVRSGRLGRGAELQLQIAELEMEKVDIEGSLLICAEQVMGERSFGLLSYSEKSGKCQLKNVRVRNLGIDFSVSQSYWQNQIQRREVCEIVLEGSGEFYAEDVELKGNLLIRVEDGYAVRAVNRGAGLEFEKYAIDKPTWWWRYRIDGDKQIILEKGHS